MSRSALYSPYDGNILRSAAWTGTAPSSSYALSTFAEFNPAKRVKFPSGTATITATISSALADVVAIAMSNIDTGSSVLSLTNGAGLNIPLTVSALPSDRLPFTVVRDLRGLAGATDRTSTVWNFVVTSNSANLTMGACLWLGTLTEFTHNFRPNLVQGEKRFNGNQPNAFGTVNRVRFRTRVRAYDVAVPSRGPQRDQLFAWARAGEGSALPSLFWPDPGINDALIGSWPDDYSTTWQLPDVDAQHRGFYPMSFTFTEWSKGYPLL